MKKLNIAQRLSPCGGATTPSLNITVPHLLTYVERFVRLACLYALPKGQRMKAVLEFTYPQDETKLRHALKGEEYYLALVEVERIFHETEATRESNQRIADLLAKAIYE
jgi:hypothetical protein